MNLDANRITIRERNMLDIFDLALLVIRAGGSRLAFAFLLGAVPAIVVNIFILRGLLDTLEFDLADDSLPGPYLYAMLALVAFEIPLAAAPLTLYLGQMMFRDRPSLRDVGRDFLRSLPQLFLFQVVARGIVVAVGYFFFPILAAPFLVRPYLNEVILLERNPLRSRRGSAQLTTYRRAKVLHKGSFGELFGRWLAAVSLGTLGIAALFLAVWILTTQLLGRQISERAAYLYLFQAGVWIALGYFTVVRFLAYLDLRIRREGWEVELVLRAEAAKLEARMT